MKRHIWLIGTLLLWGSFVLADTFMLYRNTDFITGQVTVDDVGDADPVPVTRLRKRRAVSYCNDSVNKVYVGSSTVVTSTTGHLLAGGVCVSFEVNPLTDSTTFFFKSGAGSAAITFMEVSEDQ